MKITDLFIRRLVLALVVNLLIARKPSKDREREAAMTTETPVSVTEDSCFVFMVGISIMIIRRSCLRSRLEEYAKNRIRTTGLETG